MTTLREAIAHTSDSRTVNALAAIIEQQREALQVIHDETKDYITINKLGDVYHNQSMRMVKKALTASNLDQPFGEGL